ncbi:hypothetical protein Pmani_037326 [Petrolisthes manimaculis]|uniref:Uncharacterized protein n=1 Tax=Petrolisthes manimaculis TaxID=1843537 RepID=A0AAE1NHY9_9EUCA|nr:hypothetical protein Pmani_037326 [Petrolisthes manimaculis]
MLVSPLLTSVCLSIFLERQKEKGGKGKGTLKERRGGEGERREGRKEGQSPPGDHPTRASSNCPNNFPPRPHLPFDVSLNQSRASTPHYPTPLPLTTTPLLYPSLPHSSTPHHSCPHPSPLQGLYPSLPYSSTSHYPTPLPLTTPLLYPSPPYSSTLTTRFLYPSPLLSSSLTTPVLIPHHSNSSTLHHPNPHHPSTSHYSSISNFVHT